MENRELTNRDFYYCYDYQLFLHLKKRGLYYITKAVNPRDGRMFTMFQKTDRLEEAVEEFIDRQPYKWMGYMGY